MPAPVVPGTDSGRPLYPGPGLPYYTGPMRVSALLAAMAIVVVPAAADAKPRKKKAATANKAGAGAGACGVGLLPFITGTTWTYNPAVAPLPAPDAIRRIAPAQPKQIIITVKSVEAKGEETLVTLEEKLEYDRTKPGEEKTKPVTEERTLTTTVTCSNTKFDIAPDSFFFAGEPGGYTGLDVSKLERVKGTSLVLAKGKLGEAEWREDLVMQWAHTPHKGSEAKLGSGKLEIERQFTPQEPEPVTTKMGQYAAEKLGVLTTGRVTVDNASPTTKPMELPAGWLSQLWLANGVGMVQALNSFGHMYQLVDTSKAGERPADGAAPADGEEKPEKPAEKPAKKKKKK
jgi:hypothetical protein